MMVPRGKRMKKWNHLSFKNSTGVPTVTLLCVPYIHVNETSSANSVQSFLLLERLRSDLQKTTIFQNATILRLISILIT